MKQLKAEAADWVKIIQEPAGAFFPSLIQFTSIDIAHVGPFLNHLPGTYELEIRISWMKANVNDFRNQDYWSHHQEL